MKLVGKYLLSLVLASLGAVHASAETLGNMDSAATFIGEPVIIDVLANDIGQDLTIKSVNESSVSWGQVVISDDNKSLTYTPHTSFTGYDEFWYVLQNSFGATTAGKVIVNVVNKQWPVANSDLINATYGEIVSIPVLSNDVGVELKVVSVNEGSINQGQVELSDSGVVTYQQVGEPRGNQTDEFWYVFEDKWGRKNAAKVTVYLSERIRDSWPVAREDKAISNNGLRVAISVLENDTGSELSLKSTNEWTKNAGKTEIENDIIRYTPPRGFTGTDEFWYVFEDSQGRTNSAKVEVEVTQNSELSVVSYCGVNYQTDGTLANTSVTSEFVVPEMPNYLALPQSDFISGLWGNVDGRRYNRETFTGNPEGFSTIMWMEIDGVKTKVAEADSSESLYAVGAFNKHFYYAHGNRMFAHDGAIITELTSVFEGIAGFSEESPNYRFIGEVVNNALYIKTLSGVTYPSLPTAKNSTWRVSDGLDLEPSYLGYTISTIIDSSEPSFVSRSIRENAYFNGLDYMAYFATVPSADETTEYFEFTQQKADQAPVTTQGLVSRFIQNNDRLFVMTDAHDERIGGNVTSRLGKLYVVDNYDDSLVELATCAGES